MTSTTGISSLDELNWDFKKSYISNDITSSLKVFNAFAKATYQLSDIWVSNTQFSYSNTLNDANYIFLDVNKTDSLTRRIMNIPSTFNTNQIQQNFVGDFRLGDMRNRLLVGLVYQVLKDRISVFGNYMDGFKNVAPGFTEESPDEKKHLNRSMQLSLKED